MSAVHVLVRLYAVLLAALGAALLFAPEFAGAEAPVLAQLLGAGLIGFATLTWTARGLTLGGIYGRPVVAGNQAFAFVGALVLVRTVVADPSVPAVVLLAVLTLGAVLFSVLLYTSPKS